mmetsp:Transcript_27931/g.31376  ORF Transcript_27931/g.31376 Transcript_27931/m.31376 type:complete len:222 (-) Transcript_27931:66-731(-)|eukprot:CAMPEP_0170768002 /NCGR_PEP_ID=MMETSP0733-20121128/6108_1 /TAXON_ID=186038 /ORGANISM="Fragilariopsis kerguelensis, Strain L26-C5" /LENGTH=221 /DNA_ID=CAMNT_0011109295 /DNA_START=106 /DNA_END=771 /DNA_ORIENTATION=-
MSRAPINILDRPLGGRGSRVETQVSLSAFSYLYSELVQYHQNRVDSISELERRLESSGYGVGLKILELITYRNREYKREIRLMNILHFVSTQVWKALFGKPADSLERSVENADEFMIIDYEPVTSTFCSVPADFGQLSVDGYMSGIIAGVLDGAGFSARVTAHSVALGEGEAHNNTNSSSNGGGYLNQTGTNGSLPPRKEKAVFLVKFAQEVLERDAAMDR